MTQRQTTSSRQRPRINSATTPSSKKSSSLLAPWCSSMVRSFISQARTYQTTRETHTHSMRLTVRQHTMSTTGSKSHLLIRQALQTLLDYIKTSNSFPSVLTFTSNLYLPQYFSLLLSFFLPCHLPFVEFIKFHFI